MLLIIGYGNLLRTDDAVGQVVARAVAERFKPEPLLVMTVHQLMPELAETISRAQKVVFIDAGVEGEAGEVRSAPLTPAAGTPAFTHNVNPQGLLAAAKDLYGNAPEGLLVTIGGASFEIGTRLSPELSAALPGIIDRVYDAIKAL